MFGAGEEVNGRKEESEIEAAAMEAQIPKLRHQARRGWFWAPLPLGEGTRSCVVVAGGGGSANGLSVPVSAVCCWFVDMFAIRKT